MQKLLMTATLAAVALAAVAPAAQALTLGNGIYDAAFTGEFDRRKPRIPGGSGCDDPRDLIEHPECVPA